MSIALQSEFNSTASCDLIPAEGAAISISGTAARLAAMLARADGDSTGVWADAARDTLAKIKTELAKIEAGLGNAPTRQPVAASKKEAA